MKRMRITQGAGWIGSALLVLALLLATTSAQAQLAKSGKFNIQFNWHFNGTNNELGEKHSSFIGQTWGLLSNSSGSGFLHNAGGRCSAANVVKDGKAIFVGGCVFWDADGDAAVIDYNGANDTDGWGKGTLEWRGGTGKYTGITGKTRYRHRIVTYRGNGGTSGEGEGYSLWEGEYHLP